MIMAIATKGRRVAEDIASTPSRRARRSSPADLWDKAEVMEPEGTQQITLRLPRRVPGHFKSTGKGYQSRISAVLSSSVDAMGKRKAG